VLDDAKEYKQLTIQYHYRGVKLRGIQKGAQIGTKRQFSVATGQMVLSRIDARYGALGFVPPELAGAIITGDFWAFDVNLAEVLPAYLDLFFGLPIFAKLCERASRGTTRRQRLESDLFTSIAIPWVPLDQQQVVIDKVGIAAGVAKLLGNVTEEIRELPMELVNQSFGFAWIEDNIERMHVSGTDRSAE
jgi:type I restriction enzyme, S subunit